MAWLRNLFLLDYVLRMRIRRKSKKEKDIFKINAKDVSIHAGLNSRQENLIFLSCLITIPPLE